MSHKALFSCISTILLLNLASLKKSFHCVANAFTPDGDGIDDELHVIGKGISSMEWKIFNRWGELVYNSSDANAGWSGKQSGKELNAGVYVYFLKASCANGNTITKKGNVTIIK
jgi:gliding motility-associated-like protein